MKLVLAFTSVLLMGVPFASHEQNSNQGFPELHVIKTATLAPTYGCRSREALQTGYAKTALFLSRYSAQRNSPDLLFNGACRSEDYFDASTAGDDMSLIADLGTVPVEEVSASKAFNFKRVHSFDLYSKFAREAKVEANHTYAVLINKAEVRALLIASVVEYVPNSKVVLKYAVKEYQVTQVRSEAQGFDWSSKNRVPCEEK